MPNEVNCFFEAGLHSTQLVCHLILMVERESCVASNSYPTLCGKISKVEMSVHIFRFTNLTLEEWLSKV